MLAITVVLVMYVPNNISKSMFSVQSLFQDLIFDLHVAVLKHLKFRLELSFNYDYFRENF